MSSSPQTHANCKNDRNHFMMLKTQLYELCVEFVETRLQTVIQTIKSNQQALTSETKSSVGDKHETARAMFQLEIEKAGQQLSSIQQMKKTLTKIDLTSSSEIISLGSLVETNLGNFFLSISAGRLTMGNRIFYAISTSSPIGQLLLGQTQGSELVWNGRKTNIYRIS